jgi:hypothetical protein
MGTEDPWPLGIDWPKREVVLEGPYSGIQKSEYPLFIAGNIIGSRKISKALIGQTGLFCPGGGG